MEASENSEYDSSEMNDLRDNLFGYIDEELNPYPEKLNTYIYENKGLNDWTADFACIQCGKFGVSIIAAAIMNLKNAIGVENW